MPRYTIGVDVVSGDLPAFELIRGCVKAVKDFPISVCIVGDGEQINSCLRELKFSSPRIRVLHSSRVVSMSDSPAAHCRKYPDSSIMVGCRSLRDGDMDAFFTPGNTGAALAASLYVIGRFRGVSRPCIGVLVPSRTGSFLLIDGGANVDCTSKYLRQFAIMGVSYYSSLFKVESEKVRVGILNIGTEEGKGNDLSMRAYWDLSKLPYNFVGNIEPNGVLRGDCDVLVCDGFVGNIFLKTMEATVKTFSWKIQSWRNSILGFLGLAFLYGHFQKMRKEWDPQKIGAAPLLGVQHPIFVGHGNSNENSVYSAMGQIVEILQKDVFVKLENDIRLMG